MESEAKLNYPALSRQDETDDRPPGVSSEFFSAPVNQNL